MPLPTGTRLGPYEIVSPAGAGGMGEVYRARDTRLDRSVAIKVLPTHLSSNPDLKQRFEREAKAISSLNHPHICTLHDVGAQDGIDYLVMEYLEGQTLADRLAKGRLPLDQALKIGMEIATALDRAHRQGIVHRDLKPGNIMLTKTGAKLMDFGLAKPALAIGAAASPVTPATPTMDLASLTSAAISPMTQRGTIVGTFQYMAPEVLQGAEADARSDIFAFGCVLYEMVTGRHAFEGKSQLSVMTSILEKDPEPAQTIVPTLPIELDRLIASCLAKDPAQRLQSAHDIALQLGWSGSRKEAVPEKSSVSRLAWGVAAAILILAIVAAALAWRAWPQRAILQASITTPAGLVLETVGDTAVPPVLSPDGTMLVTRGHTKSGQPSALWIRHLDTGNWQRLDGTEQPLYAFWSPDSRSIAFFTENGKLLRVSATGGAVNEIAAAPVGKGGSWGVDGTILFAPDFQSGIYRVSADGGTPVPVTALKRPSQTTHRWPQFLPDNKHFLYFASSHTGQDKQQGVYFASLDGKVNRLVLPTESDAVYASGYLLSLSGTALQARKFNPATGEFQGELQTIADGVQFDPSVWHGSFSPSRSGLLLYVQAGQTAGSQLVWYDRTGQASPLKNVPQADYYNMRVSPDDRRIAVATMSTVSDLWVIDAARGTTTRLTFGNKNHFSPVWSPDGKRIAYGQVNETGVNNQYSYGASLRVCDADGSGHDEELLPGDAAVSVVLLDWSPDGRYLLFSRRGGNAVGSLWVLPLFGEHKPFPVVTAPSGKAGITQGQISADGRWLAYASDESGRSEIYITSFPSASGKIPVTSSGGLHAMWRHDGHELFYVSANTSQVMAVDVKDRKGAKPDTSSLEVGQPHALFALGSANHVDAAPDGRRFAVTAYPETQTEPMTLIENWTALLEKDRR